MRGILLLTLSGLLGCVAIYFYILVIAYFFGGYREFYGMKIADDLSQAITMIPLGLFFNVFCVVAFIEYKSNK